MVDKYVPPSFEWLFVIKIPFFFESSTKQDNWMWWTGKRSFPIILLKKSLLLLVCGLIYTWAPIERILVETKKVVLIVFFFIWKMWYCWIHGVTNSKNNKRMTRNYYGSVDFHKTISERKTTESSGNHVIWVNDQYGVDLPNSIANNNWSLKSTKKTKRSNDINCWKRPNKALWFLFLK